jgi:hypothetical protein
MILPFRAPVPRIIKRQHFMRYAIEVPVAVSGDEIQQAGLRWRLSRALAWRQTA